jgi:hypothetical protein
MQAGVSMLQAEAAAEDLSAEWNLELRAEKALPGPGSQSRVSYVVCFNDPLGADPEYRASRPQTG